MNPESIEQNTEISMEIGQGQKLKKEFSFDNSGKKVMMGKVNLVN